MAIFWDIVAQEGVVVVLAAHTVVVIYNYNYNTSLDLGKITITMYKLHSSVLYDGHVVVYSLTLAEESGAICVLCVAKHKSFIMLLLHICNRLVDSGEKVYIPIKIEGVPTIVKINSTVIRDDFFPNSPSGCVCFEGG